MNTKRLIGVAVLATLSISIPVHAAGLLGGSGSLGGGLSGTLNGMGGIGAMGHGAGAFDTQSMGVSRIGNSALQTTHGVTDKAKDAVQNSRDELQSKTGAIKDQATSATGAVKDKLTDAVNTAKTTDIAGNVVGDVASSANISRNGITGDASGSGIANAVSKSAPDTSAPAAAATPATTAVPAKTTAPVATPAPAYTTSGNASLAKQLDLSTRHADAQANGSGAASASRSSDGASLSGSGSGNASLQR